jgi:hypothetical protein
MAKQPDEQQDDGIMTPEARYAALVETFLKQPNVTPHRPGKKGFGSSALCTSDKIFAMLVKGRLVVKLPRERVDALVAAGKGERHDPGNGRLMKEWFSIAPALETEWQPLATEALAFVAAKG